MSENPVRALVDAADNVDEGLLAQDSIHVLEIKIAGMGDARIDVRALLDAGKLAQRKECQPCISTGLLPTFGCPHCHGTGHTWEVIDPSHRDQDHLDTDVP